MRVVGFVLHPSKAKADRDFAFSTRRFSFLPSNSASPTRLARKEKRKLASPSGSKAIGHDYARKRRNFTHEKVPKNTLIHTKHFCPSRKWILLLLLFCGNMIEHDKSWKRIEKVFDKRRNREAKRTTFAASFSSSTLSCFFLSRFPLSFHQGDEERERKIERRGAKIATRPSVVPSLFCIDLFFFIARTFVLSLPLSLSFVRCIPNEGDVERIRKKRVRQSSSSTLIRVLFALFSHQTTSRHANEKKRENSTLDSTQLTHRRF